MRPTVATFAFSIVLAAAGAAQAAEEAAAAPVFNIMGSSECSRWPRRGGIDSAAKAVPLNWVLGFLSGEAEQGDSRLFDLIQPEAVAAFLDSYCQDHPTDTLPKAVRALTGDLQGRLPPLPPPPPPMFVPPAAVQPKPPAAKAPARKPAVRKPAPKRPAPARPAAPRPQAG